MIGDKAFDADAFIDSLNRRGITPVIPPKSTRKVPRACDFALYCERNLVEPFFNKLKHFRAIATRYDTLARNFLAGNLWRTGLCIYRIVKDLQEEIDIQA